MALNVEIAYAAPDKQIILDVSVAQGTSIVVAIQQSGILLEFPEIDLNQVKVGVFSRQAKLDDICRPGDRIEIYRPLKIDPKEARRIKGSDLNS